MSYGARSRYSCRGTSAPKVCRPHEITRTAAQQRSGVSIRHACACGAPRAEIRYMHARKRSRATGTAQSPEQRSQHSLTGNVHESAAHCSSCGARVRLWPWMISLPINRNVVTHERSRCCPYLPRGNDRSSSDRKGSLPSGRFSRGYPPQQPRCCAWPRTTAFAARPRRTTPVISCSISAHISNEAHQLLGNARFV